MKITLNIILTAIFFVSAVCLYKYKPIWIILCFGSAWFGVEAIECYKIMRKQ